MTRISDHQRRGLRRAHKLLSWVVWSAAAVVVLVLVVPALIGMERYVIVGDSMRGTYDRGDLVIEQRVDVADLDVGDVITYIPPRSSGIRGLVTHRIVEIDRHQAGVPWFLTRGDANEAPDPWLFRLDAAEQPRVIGSVPEIGWLLLWLADRSTRMLVIGLPAAAVAVGSASQLLSLRRHTAAKAV